MNKVGGLVANDFQDARVGVAKGIYAESTYEIEVLGTLDVPNVDTLAFCEGKWIASVGGKQVLGVDGGKFLKSSRVLSF